MVILWYVRTNYQLPSTKKLLEPRGVLGLKGFGRGDWEHQEGLWRSMGGPGIFVMAVDVLKGWVAVCLVTPLIFKVAGPGFGEGARLRPIGHPAFGAARGRRPAAGRGTGGCGSAGLGG